MTERKTSSMLQRVPVILAVTAASYGLQLPPSIARMGAQGMSGTATTASQPLASGERPSSERHARMDNVA